MNKNNIVDVFCYNREDFNNYYSEYVDEDRLPSEPQSDYEQTAGISG